MDARVCGDMSLEVCKSSLCMCVYVCVCVCIYVCVCACIRMCKCMHVCPLT